MNNITRAYLACLKEMITYVRNELEKIQEAEELKEDGWKGCIALNDRIDAPNRPASWILNDATSSLLDAENNIEDLYIDELDGKIDFK